MQTSDLLTIRVRADNSDHHLCRNSGTWWIHHLVAADPRKKAGGVRALFGTRCVLQTRTRRNARLRNTHSGQITASSIREVAA